MTEDDHSTLEAIESQRNRWITAINSGDPDGFVAALTDDAVWLPWRQTAIDGRQRIREWISGPLEAFDYDYSLSDVRVRLAGAWAVEQARFRTQATMRDGSAAPAPTHEGFYTILWRHTSSTGWLIERYIDHTPDDTVN